jgi:uncharacterized protein (UPF0248 family)
MPIHELLNRIRWDTKFGQADFEIGYYDRVEDRIIHVPMREIFFETGDHFAFDLYDKEGELHSIPLHRVKEVIRNGELIWHREH